MDPINRVPDYLVIGHISKDVLPGGQGYAPGGTALYSSIAAQRLGLQAAIVTACAPGDAALMHVARDAGVWVRAAEALHTTTFLNVYDSNGRRTQVLEARANDIDPDDVPGAWRGAGIVHLGPIAREVPAELVNSFPHGLLGITPQGWMRSWDDRGHVTHTAWPLPSALRGLPSNAVLVLSVEDLGYSSELIQYYVNLAPVVVVTAGPEAALVCEKGRCNRVPAFAASVLDPTGAGDVFASALFLRYRETGMSGDGVLASARFAHAAAACNIEGAGVAAIPYRARVEERCTPTP